MPDITLAQVAELLTNTIAAVRDLAKKVDIGAASLRRIKAFAVMLAISLAFDILLTGAVGWNQFGLNNSQRRINELQTQLELETQRNKVAQCALFALLLQFEPKTTANPTYTPEEHAQQLHAYGVFHQISGDLGCATK